jgi:oligopeptide transport system substrate-binding protein
MPAVNRRRHFLRIGLGLLAVVLGGCARRGPTSPPEKARAPILRLSQRNEPGDLDPATATIPDEFFIIRALSEGLVSPSPDGNAPRPAAAEHWSVSPDSLTYTFHLRAAARWSNGEPVTAQDFVDSYHRLLTPATAATKASLFYLVKNAEAFYRGTLTDFAAVGFRARDALTLDVTLAQPAPQFLAYAASGPWIPVNPRTVARFGRDWTRPGNFVGNGPFLLTEWRPHQRIVVRRRADYWDAAQVPLAGLQFLAFDNGDAEDRAFRAGQLDVTMAVPIAKLAAYAREEPVVLHRVPLHETRYLALNTRRPPLDDVRVRRALALALDREALVTHVLQGGQAPARHLVPEQLGGFVSHATLREDATEARRLLAAAGFPGGAGFPRLELTGWDRTPILEAVQAMWQKELGIGVALTTRDARVHVTALQEGHYDVGFVAAIPDVADAADLLADFATGAPRNFPQWSDPAYDALLAAAARKGDAAPRLALLAAAEDRLTDECPVVPLYFNAKNFLLRPAVRGWQEDALWTRFYKNVSLLENKSGPP